MVIVRVGKNSLKFPGADYFKRLSDEETYRMIEEEEKLYESRPHPNPYVFWDNWYEEFRSMTRRINSPYCYKALMDGKFDKILMKRFRKRVPVGVCHWRVANSWDKMHGYYRNPLDDDNWYENYDWTELDKL